MPTLQQFQNVILSAELQMANLIEADRLKFVIGKTPTDAKEIDRYNNNILALSHQVYGRVDYTSLTTLSLYDCLNNLVGVDTSTATLDPNYQAPNTTIVIEQGGATTANLFFSEAQLVDSGGGNWYLPYSDPRTPLLLLVNGVMVPINIDENFSPARIYGFASNSPQSIQLTVI